MKIIPIKSKKQDNGLWGMPKNCYYIEHYFQLEERNEFILSALINCLNTKFNERFEMSLLSEKKIYFKFEKHGTVILSFNDYEVFNDKLYEFDNVNEHNIFMRKQKLIEINV